MRRILRVIPVLIVGLWATMARADDAQCAAPEPLVHQLENAVVDGQFDKVEALLTQVENRFACSRAAAPETLARMWLAEGVWLTLIGDGDGAAAALAAATRVSPSTWNPDYGHALRLQAQQLAAEFANQAPGTLTVDPEPVGWAVVIDGLPGTVPASVAVGLHLVQVLDEKGEAQLARVVPVRSGLTVSVEARSLSIPGPLASISVTKAFPAPPPTDDRLVITSAAPPPTNIRRAEAPAAVQDRSFPAFLVTGAVAGVAAGATGWLAMNQSDQMSEAESLATLDAAFGRQKLLAAASYGCMGLAATGFALHFVF